MPRNRPYFEPVFIFGREEMLRLVVGWLLRFVVAPVAIIVFSLLALAYCAFVLQAKAAEDCESIRIANGEADYLVAYRKDSAWWLSAPGEESSKVHEGQVLVMEEGADLGVIIVRDSKGKVIAKGYDWHLHGASPKRFCLR